MAGVPCREATRCDGRAIGYRDDAPFPPLSKPAVVAFYLPQYHPTPENDAWWGKGFTEWRNVARALPQFEGHDQPRLPGELGFYDLRLPDTLRRQVELAHRYGVAAFCFYVYWFNGRRVLERPVDHYLSDSTLDLPFCLCWANESWTRRWDGRDEEILLQQQHGEEDDGAFIEAFSPFLRDPRYLRVGGKPLLVLYRLDLLPDPAATATRWREHCRAAGIGEIHLACVESFQRADPRPLGFDSAIEFPPNLTRTFGLSMAPPLLNPDYRGEVLDWGAMASQFRTRARPPYPLFRGVNPGWDNEPRRPGRGRSFVGHSVRGYEAWLREAVADSDARDSSRLVFVNAWNEWAEGAHLEPDARLGHAWLAATRRAQLPAPARTVRPCAVVHAYYPELLPDILQRLDAHPTAWRVVLTTVPEQQRAVQAIAEEWRARTLDRTHEFALEVRSGDNRGRDVLPFLRVADELLEAGEDLVLKLHTKRSLHLANGATWRTQLLDALAGPSFDAIWQAFRTDPSLGMVGPVGHALDTREHLGANVSAIDFLRRRLDLRTRGEPRLFFAGSMYWVRLDALRPLLDAHLNELAFAEEKGQLDGTLAHAIERLVPAIVNAAGFRVAASDAPAETRPPLVASDYPFIP